MEATATNNTMDSGEEDDDDETDENDESEESMLNSKIYPWMRKSHGNNQYGKNKRTGLLY